MGCSKRLAARPLSLRRLRVQESGASSNTAVRLPVPAARRRTGRWVRKFLSRLFYKSGTRAALDFDQEPLVCVRGTSRNASRFLCSVNFWGILQATSEPKNVMRGPRTEVREPRMTLEANFRFYSIARVTLLLESWRPVDDVNSSWTGMASPNGAAEGILTWMR